MSTGEKKRMVEPLPSEIQILTWNVDYMTTHPTKRLVAALAHIQKDVFSCRIDESPEPCCILLQEVNQSAFHAILENEWIRKHFAITPVAAPEKWPDGYGNVTLVSRSIPIRNAWSLEFDMSKMSRTALLVDLTLSAQDSNSEEIALRVGNTHLESLPEGDRARVVQMGLVAKLLNEEGLDGGIVGGDMNAIGPSDGRLAAINGLLDAWQGLDEDEEGFTWGYQGGGDHPPGRLDKVLFTNGRIFDVDEPTKVGVGVKTGDGLWVSDHYGLLTTVRVLLDEDPRYHVGE